MTTQDWIKIKLLIRNFNGSKSDFLSIMNWLDKCILIEDSESKYRILDKLRESKHYIELDLLTTGDFIIINKATIKEMIK